MPLYNIPAVWGKDHIGKINCGLFFRLITDIPNEAAASFTLSAKQVYKIILNGQTVGYGPERTAHGYSKVDRLTLNFRAGKNILIVEVLQPFVENYYIIKENAYFCAELKLGGKSYTTEDFSCYLQADRVEASQRYSPQRTFAESYDMYCPRTDFYNGAEVFDEIQTAEVKRDILIERDCDYPDLPEYGNLKLIDEGSLWINKDKEIKEEDRFIIDERFEHFRERENLTDTVSYFEYNTHCCSEGRYYFYELGREITGFINLKLVARSDAEIYVLFDEILGSDGDIKVNRLSCANIIKWKLKKGEYTITSFEPYSLKYLKICVVKGEVTDILPSVTLYENKSAYKRIRVEHPFYL